MEGGARETAALVGRTLGEFVVREPLGSGGFGTVFRAEQPALGREAVIKVLHPDLVGSANTVQRFLREARLASRLDHPYAAHTYAFGAEPDGTLWIAMELCRGTPLDRMLAQGPIPLERFVPLLERISEVVHTAHEQGIVHRDLKPANVMVLARAGRLLPKLLDFGIAKVLDATGGGTRPGRSPTAPPESFDAAAIGDTTEDSSSLAVRQTVAAPGTEFGATLLDPAVQLTSGGSMIGSPPYMAPEQWFDAAAVDARTDVYALGVLAFEALTGRVPFAGSRSDIARQHATAPVPSLGAGFPPELDAVLACALAKRPEDRHPSVLELSAAFRAGSGVAADPASLPRPSEAARATAMAGAPQPLAQAVAHLDGARNAHQARDALWRLVRVAVRLLGVTALASHTHVREEEGAATGEAGIEALRGLRNHALSDAAWLALARELVRPFSALRDAHPVPELVDFLTGAPAGLIEDLIHLRSGGESADAGSESEVLGLLARAMPIVDQLLASLDFFSEYALVVPRGGGAQEWMGTSRNQLANRQLPDTPLPAGRPLLIDAGGLPLVSLWPFVQLHEPAPGSPPALFFLEGKGRRGARLVALPGTFEREDEELWDSLGGVLGRRMDSEADGDDDESCPFPGLAPFTADDAEDFTGREREAEAFLNRLRVTPLLAVVGPSGAGKSSFVQAGVLPAMAAEWTAVTVRPGTAPLAGLSAALAAAGVAVDSARPGDALRAEAAARATRFVIVVDQLEELFTLCDDDAERALYAEALVDAVRSADDPVRVILTLRDDFLLRAEALPALRSRLGPALQLLTTPAANDLRRILCGPLRRRGYDFDDQALPGEMAEAVVGAPGALALLSFTASRLWELRDRRFHQITRKAYRSLGGIGGALVRHAEATLDAMRPEERRLVREVFRHAVTAEGTRAALTRAELEEVLGGGARAASVIEKLLSARLLVVSETEGGGERVEIIHEALLETWPRLVTWRREDREGARLRDQLRTAARQWMERGSPKGLLWRGDALAEYRLWRSRHESGLTEAEAAFAEASLADAARGRRRLRFALAAVVTGLAAVSAVLLWMNARAERQGQFARAASAESQRRLADNYHDRGRQLLLAGDAARGLAYLAEAHRLGVDGPGLVVLLNRGISALGMQEAALRGHQDMVFHAAFSPDGSRVVTSSFDRTAAIWNAGSGHRLVALVGHENNVYSAAFSPDGRRVATASWDGTARIWDAGSGRNTATLRHQGLVLFARFSPDGARVVTASEDGTAGLFDAATGTRLASLQHRGPVVDASFSADGTRIITASRDGTAGIWDSRSGERRVLLAGHSDTVQTAALAPDGRRVLTTSWDHTARIWDATSGDATAVLRGHNDTVWSGAFSADGTRVVTGSFDRTAKVWDAESGQLVVSIEGHQSNVSSASFDPAGKRVLTSSFDGTAGVWDAATGKQLTHLVGHLTTIWYAEFSPDGRRVVTASQDFTAMVWEHRTESLVRTLEVPGATFWFATYSPDGRQLATISNDGIARLWDAGSGALLTSFRERPAAGADTKSQLVLERIAAAFDPAGRRLAITHQDAVDIWDLERRKRVVRLAGHSDKVQGVAWSPDGRRVATGSVDKTVKIWDAASGRALMLLTGHRDEIQTVAFAPDGRLLLSASGDRTARLWDAATGELIRVIKGHRGLVWCARFSPDGRRVVTASGDQTAKIWNTASGEVLASLEGHRADLFGAVFSPDGHLVLTTGIVEGSVKLWDEAGLLLVSHDLHVGFVNWAEFSPDGETFATAGSDGVVRIWSVQRDRRSTSELVAEAECLTPFALQAGQLVPRVRSRCGGRP